MYRGYIRAIAGLYKPMRLGISSKGHFQSPCNHGGVGSELRIGPKFGFLDLQGTQNDRPYPKIMGTWSFLVFFCRLFSTNCTAVRRTHLRAEPGCYSLDPTSFQLGVSLRSITVPGSFGWGCPGQTSFSFEGLPSTPVAFAPRSCGKPTITPPSCPSHRFLVLCQSRFPILEFPKIGSPMLGPDMR